MAAVAKPSLDNAGILSLRILVAVADSGSFSATGRQLRLSASAVTNHVLSLERMLGVALFHRTTRTVSITPAGERFYKKARQILDQVDEALHDVAPGARLTGHIRVTAPPSFAMTIIAPNLGAFFEANPGISVDFIVSSAKPNMIADRIDVAFLLREAMEGNFASELIAENPRAFCASPSYLEKHGIPEGPEELSHHLCLGNMVAARAEPWAVRDGKTTRLVSVKGPLVADNGEMLRSACLSGAGIGNFYRFHINDDLENGRLVEVLARYQPDTNRTYAVTPHREMVRPLAQIFINFVKDVYHGARLKNTAKPSADS